jgi:alcohol dehydrogenase class IV
VDDRDKPGQDDYSDRMQDAVGSAPTAGIAPFVYTGLPCRVIFGRGTLARAADELRALGAKRALVLSTPEQAEAAEALARQLGDLAAGVFPGAAMHTPVEVTERAMQAIRARNADAVVSLGGGSTTGLGKAIALHTGLPQLAIPTTYAGSEMTPILGQTEAGKKTTIRDAKVLPQTVIYDVELTYSLPAKLSATSGLNAVAHAVEALYAKEKNPIISLMARQAIAALAAALPIIAKEPRDPDARDRALYGAWLCGVALGAVGMALHHKLCHVLGGSFDLPHAETHAVVLPHATSFNAEAVPALLAPIAVALGAEGPGQGLHDLARAIGAPASLKELGLPESALDRAADIATEQPYWNPRPVTRDAIRALLDDAWAGRRPRN